MKEILYQLVYVYVNEPSRNRRFSSALQPEAKKCKNANEDAADFEPPNEHQSKFDARGDAGAVVGFRQLLHMLVFSGYHVAL